MKNLLSIFLITVIIGCSYKPNEKRLLNFQNHNAEILTSLYRIDTDTLQIARIISNDGKQLLKLGKIWMGDYAITHQEFISTTEIKNKDSIQKAYKRDGYTHQLMNERDVMFIQIVPDSGMSEIEAFGFLNFRQEMEDKIDLALKQKHQGEWFAGDMGAGGNMLFFIDNWEQAIKTVKNELANEDLLDHVLITKRLNTAPDDWTYEVVFPVEYEGVFNQM
ncbi:hypothetical protein [Flammeovirga sp. SJP92]|uniref:hypothetical protein n=1 Tax=Flammeovirga sp. SJP92 TaxID=1775430 RepID=UPI0012F724C1|nr:hypothetical protein [Flammeovirga sp. SJP92]